MKLELALELWLDDNKIVDEPGVVSVFIEEGVIGAEGESSVRGSPSRSIISVKS